MLAGLFVFFQEYAGSADKQNSCTLECLAYRIVIGLDQFCFPIFETCDRTGRHARTLRKLRSRHIHERSCGLALQWGWDHAAQITWSGGHRNPRHFMIARFML